MAGSATHYEILMVDRNAGSAKIREARNRLAKKLHPDHAGHATTAVMQAVNAAFKCLSDPDLRRHYDLTLPAKITRHVFRAPTAPAAASGTFFPSNAEEKVDPSKVVVDDYCGDFYAGRCWGMGCTKIHCSQAEFWDFVTNKTVSAGAIKQIKR